MEYTIIRCKGCSKLFRFYPWQVYEGDPNYCPSCNKASGSPPWVINKYKNLAESKQLEKGE